MNRWRDWYEEGLLDLARAERALGDEDWPLASFLAHQAAEKCVKALIMFRGGVGWGHSVLKLLKELRAPEPVLNCARGLEPHYILSRYPNGYPAGRPSDYYTEKVAREALDAAKEIISWCQGELESNG